MQKNRQAFIPRRRSEFVCALLFLAAAAGISPVAPSRAIATDEIKETTPEVAGNQPEVSQPLSLPVELPSSLGLAAPAMGVKGGLGASVGVTRDSFSSAPAMLGDFFGGSFLDLDNQGIGSETISINGGDRRFKVAENVSPMPRDRVFVNYNHFENALKDHRGKSISLDRYTPGFEKTFFDKSASLEVRLPVARGMSSSQDLSSSDTQGSELGNLALAAKVILLRGSSWVISGGSSLTLPTGDDYVLQDGANPILRIENGSVHMAPFIGWLVMPNRDWFLQGFFQTDFDLNGNVVRGGGNTVQGIIQDQNLLFVDASIGKWLFRSLSRKQSLTGIAALSELHYTSTMNDSDRVGDIGNSFQNVDVLNLSGAFHFQFGLTSLRLGGAVPLREREEKLFDAEVIAQLSQAF